jgi:hypothetical protein
MPKVFVSYSYDSPEHKDRVLKLSNRLRAEGVECHIDQYEQSPMIGWPLWCERQVEDADFVLVASTVSYLRRYRREDTAGVGRGASWEGHIITQELYQSQGGNAKFIPIIFTDDDVSFIPTPLKGSARYKLFEEYDQLYRRLTNQPSIVAPPIGSVRPMPSRQLPADRTLLETRKEVVVVDPPIQNPVPSPAPIPTVAKQDDPRSSQSSLRVLCALADPLDKARFSTDSIWDALQQAKDLARGQVTSEKLAIPSEAALQERLASVAWDMFYFVGHAECRAAVKYSSIFLQNSSGHSRSLDADYFAGILAACPTLRTVVLQACDKTSFCFDFIAGELLKRGMQTVVMLPPLSSAAAGCVMAKLYASILTKQSPKLLELVLRVCHPEAEMLTVANRS